ncbi:DivIVA domain-containing protein [Nocardioides sp. S5]|uniref:DivIVA domain-containing protein n=1 Tax=Nocardioides sp. S5 TaxID=2017486 RepID=UPI001F5C23B3|nr:DivIVA domain-containing protein [Nocardioides sp. S5]
MALERPRFSTTRLREGYDVADVDTAVDRVFVALADGATSMTASDVSSLRFNPVRLAEGYDMGEVDSWLDQAAAELGRTSGGAAPATPAARETPASAAYETTSGTRSDAVTEVRSSSPRILVVLALVVLLAIVAYAFYA